MMSVRPILFSKNALKKLLASNISRKEYIHVSSVGSINYQGDAVSPSTNVSFLTRDDQTHIYLSGYSKRGFILSNGFRTWGPTVVFPKAVLHWMVQSAERLEPKHVSMFCLMEPKIDVLIIGKGDWDTKVDTDIIRYMKTKRITTEILPTEQAMALFNMLNNERRVVAAALIPPTSMIDPDDNNRMDMPDPQRSSEPQRQSLDTDEYRHRVSKIQEEGFVKAWTDQLKEDKELEQYAADRDKELRRKGLIPEEDETKHKKP